MSKIFFGVVKCQRESDLWEKINLLFKKVQIGFLGLAIRNGCKYLSLFGAKLIGEDEDFTQFWENCRELKVRKIQISKW